MKLNASTGGVFWTYTNTTNFTQFSAVATDTLGNTYATGLINDPANGNGLTVKLSSAGAASWSKIFDGTAALFDSLSNVAVDPNGDCIVGGGTRITNTPATDTDAIILKYAAATGNETWRRLITGASAGSDSVNNLVVDASGDIYAVGSIRNISGSDRDAYAAKITGTTGVRAWITTRLGTAADSSDRFQNVRVSGSAVYAVGNIDHANRDILASRFNASTGAEEWTFTFNGSGNGTDDVFSGKNLLTLLGSNAIAIGGETRDVSTNTFGIVMKYAASLPPTVTNVSRSTNEDVAVAFAAANFTGSYSDPNSDPLTIVRITSLPANGVLKNGVTTISTVPTDIAIANIGNLTYTSNLNYNGADSFGWNGSNGAFFAVSGATVNLTVAAVNDKPTFTAANPPTVSEDAGAQTIVGWATFNAGAANESGQAVLAYAVSSVSNAALFSASPGIATNGTLSYTPAANANGTSTFQLRVQDNGGVALSGIDLSDAQTFTITVNAVNDVPVITGQNAVSTPEEAARAIALADLIVTDVDNAGYPAGFTLTVANGTNYTRSGNTITPTLNFNGPLTVPVTVTDPAAGVSISFNLSVTVTALNDAPVITGQSALSTAFNTARSITLPDLTVTDVDNTYPTGFTLSVQNGTNYTRSGNTITPALNFVGTLSVPAQVNDGAANSNIFNLAVTVNPSLLAAQNGSSIAPEPGGGYRISFLGNPGQTYTIQYSSNLAPMNWQFLGTRTADANGRYSDVDIPPPGTPMRFYRSILP